MVALILAVALPYAPASGASSTRIPTLHLDYYILHPTWTLDPALTTTPYEADTLALINANLVRVLPDGTVVPDLATWGISANHRTYTFTLRGDARFSNGHGVTAQDADFSLLRALAPPTGSIFTAGYLNVIEGADAFSHGRKKTVPGIQVLNSRQLRITLTKQAAYFLGALSLPAGYVLDRKVVAGKPIGAPPEYSRNFLTNTCQGNQGAGPFRFVCRNGGSGPHSFYLVRENSGYTLEPNPFYYGSKPQIRIGLPRVSGGFGYKPYLAGTLDTTRIPPVFLRQWKGRIDQLRESPSSLVTEITPNVHLAPFNNVHCRLAVAYAIDRETIARTVLQGTARATYAVVPQGMLGYYGGNDSPHFDRLRAQAELARCPGRTSPFRLTYNITDHANEFVAIGAMLQSVGLNVKLQALSNREWVNTVSGSLDLTHTQLLQNHWLQDYPDPQDYCTLLLRSGEAFNIGGWHNAAYDRLVDRADQSFDPHVRAALYIRAQRIALTQGAWISLTNSRSQYLVKPYVHGLVGSEAYFQLVAVNGDWSRVSVSPH
ncbi:MAG: ABC transporter substrate-binding protein [Chloroflexota bacterium]